MKNVQNSNRVLRVNPDLHRLVKIAAATDGIPLAELVGRALERELNRRARRQQKAAIPET